MTDGNITRLTGVISQINRVLIPIGLTTAAAASDSPSLNRSEVIGIAVARSGDCYAKMLSRIHVILGTSPEAKDTAQFHLRGNQVVVRSQGLRKTIGIRARNHHIGRTVMAFACEINILAQIDTACC